MLFLLFSSLYGALPKAFHDSADAFVAVVAPSSASCAARRLRLYLIASFEVVTREACNRELESSTVDGQQFKMERGEAVASSALKRPTVVVLGHRCDRHVQDAGYFDLRGACASPGHGGSFCNAGLFNGSYILLVRSQSQM